MTPFVLRNAYLFFAAFFFFFLMIQVNKGFGTYLASLFLIIMAGLNIRKNKATGGNLELTGYFFALIALPVLASSLAFSQEIYQIKNLLIGTVLFFVLITLFSTDGHRNIARDAVIAVTVIHALDGLVQYFYGVELIRARESWPGMRITGGAFNPNPYGLFMAVGALVIYHQALTRKHFISYASLLLVLAACFLSGSRGAWLAFAAGALSLHLMPGHGKKPLAYLGVAALVVAMGLSFILPDAALNRLAEASSSYRFTIWLAALKQPLVEIALGNGVDYYQHLAISKEFAGVHNVYLDTLLAAGFWGLISLLFGIYHVVKRGFSLSSQDHWALACLVCVLVAGLFDYSYITSISYLFLMLIPVAVILSAPASQSCDPSRKVL